MPHYEVEIDDQIYREFKTLMCEEVCNNPEGCTLPLNLGWIKVEADKFNPRRRNPSKEGDIRYKAYNLETGGKVYSLSWYSEVIRAIQSKTPGEAFDTSGWFRAKSCFTIKMAIFKAVKENRHHNFHDFVRMRERKKLIK